MNTDNTEPPAQVQTPPGDGQPQARTRAKERALPPPSSLQEIVGALLFASESPLSVADIRECIRSVHPEEGENAEVLSVYETCTSREVEAALHGLEKELERSGSGFRLVNAGGSYRLQTSPQCGRYVRALLHLDRPSRLSRASLETLAIVAYRQPISKAEIEQIRGVGVDTMIKTLLDLQLVRLVGRSELPGHPFLYGTTPLFLEHFGLASLQQLNELDPTLQREDPKVRAKLYEKKKPAPPPDEPVLPGLDGAPERKPQPGDAARPESGAEQPPPEAEDGEDGTDAVPSAPIFLKPPVDGEDGEQPEQEEGEEEP